MTIAPFYPPNSLTGLPRGNLIVWSNNPSNGAWAKVAGAISGSSTPPPGLSGASQVFAEDTSNGQHYCYAAATVTAGKTYTASAYLFSNNRGARFIVEDNAGNFYGLSFDLAGGSGASVLNSNGFFQGGSYSLTPVGSGWWRASVTVTAPGALLIAIVNPELPYGTVSYTGDGSSGVAVYGTQIEPGSVAGIPVTTGAVADLGIWGGAQGLPVLPFLPGQTPTVTKAPMWSTEVVRTVSGRERRTSYWPYPLWQFELQYGVIRHRPTNAELLAMWEFFNLAQGQFGPWLFVDPADCQVPASAPVRFATGDGSTTSFQLSRAINSVYEPVYDVYQPAIYDDGALTVSGLSFSGNGVVTFATPPVSGHALSWSGYFYFGCRFLQDDLSFEQIVSQLWTGKSLKFTSLRA